MSHHSSIFSFKTLRITFRMPYGLLTALVLLTILDFGVSRANWPYRYLRSSYVSEFLAIEKRLDSRTVKPHIIIMGNSRSACGLLAPEMEHSLQLPPGSVQNLSLSMGDHVDNLLLYRRNRRIIKQAPLLIYAVDAYQWNEAVPLTERFRHFANMRDRWIFDRTPQSLLGYFFRTTQMKPLYHAIGEDMIKRIGELNLLMPAVTTKETQKDTAPETVLYPSDLRINQWYTNFSVSLPRENSLHQMLIGARDDGQRVILIQFPFRDEFVKQVALTHANDYRTYVGRINQLGAPEVLIFETASSCGLSAAEFQDWDHLTFSGAHKFTNKIIEYLLDQENVAPGNRPKDSFRIP